MREGEIGPTKEPCCGAGGLPEKQCDKEKKAWNPWGSPAPAPPWPLRSFFSSRETAVSHTWLDFRNLSLPNSLLRDPLHRRGCCCLGQDPRTEGLGRWPQACTIQGLAWMGQPSGTSASQACLQSAPTPCLEHTGNSFITTPHPQLLLRQQQSLGPSLAGLLWPKPMVKDPHSAVGKEAGQGRSGWADPDDSRGLC